MVHVALSASYVCLALAWPLVYTLACYPLSGVLIRPVESVSQARSLGCDAAVAESGLTFGSGPPLRGNMKRFRKSTASRGRGIIVDDRTDRPLALYYVPPGGRRARGTPSSGAVAAAAAVIGGTRRERVKLVTYRDQRVLCVQWLFFDSSHAMQQATRSCVARCSRHSRALS